MTTPAEDASETSSWVDKLGDIMERWVPDALTTAILLMVVLIQFALLVGAGGEPTFSAYYRGLWMFLSFTMQMTLILVLSLVISASPVFTRIVGAIAKIPRTRAGVVTGAALCCGCLAYVNWGISLAMGPVVAIYFCREAEDKGIDIDFLFLLAVMAGVGSIWQFGLSASAPLVMADPDQKLVQIEGVTTMSLSSTIWSTASLVHVAAFVTACIVAGCWLMPRNGKSISQFPDALRVAEISNTPAEVVSQGTEPLTPAKQLEHSRLLLIPLIAMLVAWLYFHFFVKERSVDINTVNTILLLLGLVLHQSVHKFQAALQNAIKLSWPIVVLYQLYAGVAGLIQFTPVGETIVAVMEPIATPYTLPLLTAMVSTVVAIFIPTSGGQWAIQGAVTSQLALQVGITPQRALLALSVGDHMGNLLTPFWAVVGANIARVDFRLYFGYRLIFAALWFVIGVLCFTFLPC